VCRSEVQLVSPSVSSTLAAPLPLDAVASVPGRVGVVGVVGVGEGDRVEQEALVALVERPLLVPAVQVGLGEGLAEVAGGDRDDVGAGNDVHIVDEAGEGLDLLIAVGLMHGDLGVLGQEREPRRVFVHRLALLVDEARAPRPDVAAQGRQEPALDRVMAASLRAVVDVVDDQRGGGDRRSGPGSGRGGPRARWARRCRGSWASRTAATGAPWLKPGIWTPGIGGPFHAPWRR
jgi:hypothetical protein